MSISMYLYPDPARCPNCGHELPPTEETEIHWQNITHNVSPMWRRAGVYEALYEAEGKRVDASYLETLRAGVAKFEAEYPEFEKLNSPNGWGLAKHALPWLKQWLEACEHNVGATIGVSK